MQVCSLELKQGIYPTHAAQMLIVILLAVIVT